MTEDRKIDSLAGVAVGLAALGMVLAIAGAALRVEALLVISGLVVLAAAVMGAVFFGYCAYLTWRRS